MIKYFYYEEYHIDGKWIIENEKVLYERPEVNRSGYSYFQYIGHIKYYIDVEKRIKYSGFLDSDFQEIYDKLLLEDRNKKLETL